MKNGRISLAFVSACLLAMFAIGMASAQGRNEKFDLTITEVGSLPAAAGVGDEVTIYVTYENLLPTAVPPDLNLDLAVTMISAESRHIIEQCRQPVYLSSLILTDGPQRIQLSDCSITLQDPETYLLRAEFVESGKAIPEGPYSLLPGDIDGSNNGHLSTVIPVIATQDESLPADIARIFAGLAIFFAVMALVAVGTEVVIDSLKVGVGLKRKVNSMEALERMEKYLPGELAALSVSAASREQYKRMMQEMRITLDHTLHSVADISTLRDQVAKSEFGEAYRKAEALLPENGVISQQNLYKLKKQLFSFANQIANALENQLYANPNVIQTQREQIAQEISLFDGQNPGDFLEGLFDTLQDIHFWSVQVADGWLKNQQEVLFDRSSGTVLANFRTEVRPVLEGVGFATESISQVEKELASRLRIVETGISQTTDTFVTSVKNVLDAVEMRRYETQSPARKIWRILRSWQGGLFPPVNARGVFIPSLVFAFLLLFGAWLVGLINTSNSMTQFIGSRIPGFDSIVWLPWFLLFFAASVVVVLLLSLIGKSFEKSDYPWFIGIYGATALSLLTGLLGMAVVWLLQTGRSFVMTGQLVLFSWNQPWWSWMILFSTVTLIFLLIVGQLGKAIYEHLVNSAVAVGRIGENRHKLRGSTTLLRVETFWNLLRKGFDVTEVDPDSFNKAESVAGYEELSQATNEPDFRFSAETTAQFIMQRTDQQRDEETSRLRVLRVISIIVGLIIAYVLQIDVLRLLGEAFPGVLESINITIITGETLNNWRAWLPVDKAITVGIVLTGFAASAGSAFWHDRLDQLQASKKGAQAAATLLSQASQVANSVDQNSSL